MPVTYFGRNGSLFPAPPPAGELWFEFHDIGTPQVSVLCHGAWHPARGNCDILAPVESIYFFSRHGDPVDHDTGGWSSINAAGLIMYPEITPVGGIGSFRPERVLQGNQVQNYSIAPHDDAEDNVKQLEGWKALQDNTPSLIVARGVIAQGSPARDYLCLEDIIYFFRNIRNNLRRDVTIRFYGCRNVI